MSEKRFDSASHTYYLKDNKVMSVSAFMAMYKPQFNSNMVINTIKDSDNWKDIAPDDIRLLWDLKGDVRRNIGNAVHCYLHSQFIKPGYVKPDSDYLYAAQKCYDFIVERFDILEAEKFEISEKYNLGYTKDLLLQSKKTGAVLIGDYKSNEAFTMAQYKDLKKKPKRLLHPFAEYYDVSEDTVKLQTTLYKYLYNSEPTTKIKADNCVAFHINPRLYSEGFGVYTWVNEQKAMDNFVEQILLQQVTKYSDDISAKDKLISRLASMI